MTLSIDQITPSNQNRFTGVRLDRLVEHRDDETWLANALTGPAVHYVPLWRSRNLLQRTPDGTLAVYLRPDDLPDPSRIQPPTLLGSDDKRLYFAVALTDEQRDALQDSHPDAVFADLRRESIDMDAKHAGILAYAKALHYWQHRHRFCGVCGHPNQLLSAGHRLQCGNPECARSSFPRIDPAIIVLVTHEGACLLGRNPRWPPRRFSTLAGFVEPGESLEDAVIREVDEETGVKLQQVNYVSSQPWPFPASAMCGFYAEATSKAARTSDEIEELGWFTPDELVQAVRTGDILLSPPVSISFRLLADWFEGETGRDLDAIVREARAARANG